MSKALSVWYKLFEEQIASVKDSFAQNATMPKLLLHACCAPCSSAVLELLEKYFEITIFYYNPNIYPQEEYNRRRDELYNFLKARTCKACKIDGAKIYSAENFAPCDNDATSCKDIKIIEVSYNADDFYDAVKTVKDFEKQKEKGERCFACYKLRIERAIEYALCNNFDFVTTTLSISPHKDADAINQIGEKLTKDLCDKNMTLQKMTKPCTYLYADFKKKNGFARSLELSSEYGLYRQEYCGCIFSYSTRGFV